MEQVESPGVPTSPSPQQYPVGYAPPPPMMMEQAKQPANAISSQRWVLNAGHVLAKMLEGGRLNGAG